jgi:hypothetical protein
MKKNITPSVICTFAKKVVLICSLVALPTVGTFAQCKGFVKKQMTKLSPFIHNGQANSSVLLSGDHAELTLTFYSGQTYRLLVSSQESLGDVFFIMRDANKAQIFSSKEQGKFDFRDFTVESTQQMTIEIMVPNADIPSGLVPSGCVSVLVGFKQ